MTSNEFIQNIIDTRGQWPDYLHKKCARHHIKPRCKGGEPKTLTWDKHENIIWLTNYEHLIIHKLLALENKGDKQLTWAYYQMSKKFKEFLTEEEIEEAITIHTKNVWNKGKKMSKEFCDNVSKSHLGLKYSNRKKINLSDSHKSNISKAISKVRNRNKAIYGTSLTPQAIEKLRVLNTGKVLEKITCPHCGKVIGGKSNYNRHINSRKCKDYRIKEINVN